MNIKFQSFFESLNISRNDVFLYILLLKGIDNHSLIKKIDTDFSSTYLGLGDEM